jgi:glycosyltransferase involved in cell wall biosynthesis
LKKTLDCIIKQTYKNLEIIVSDDCSPEKSTLTIAQEHAKRDPRIKVYIQIKNLGAAKNIDFVLTESTGDYFMWADDEDMCANDLIEKCMHYLIKDSSVVLCASDLKVIDDQDKIIKTVQHNKIRSFCDWKKTRKIFFQYPASSVFFCYYGVYHSKTLRRTGTSDLLGWKNYAINDEVPFLAKIATFGKIIAIPEVLKTYRMNPYSLYHREISTISKIDWLILRFTVRIRLFQIAYQSNLSSREKISLYSEIIISGVKGFIRLQLGNINRIAPRLKNSIKKRMPQRYKT